MVIKYGSNSYISDNDLKVNFLGFWPRADIKGRKLKKFFKKNYQRTFLGGDELVAYSQSLVSHGMNFAELEQEILTDIKKPENTDFKEVLFGKTATGIGRGHSLGGLSGVVLGLHGTKMLDSALTGLCASRSLATSSRRRETVVEEITIPESLTAHPELLKEYMEISREILKLSVDFKERFGKLGGVETFNKIIPYNNPADLFIVLPLDTLSTINSEVRADKMNKSGRFIPREIYSLIESFPELTKEVGQNIMFGQRKEVPRDTYLHYSVFKDPSLPNYALEKGKSIGMSLGPQVIGVEKDFTGGFFRALLSTVEMFERTKKVTNSQELHNKSLEAISALRDFTGEYNEALRIKLADNLSWRVWSEQKRHSTLRQNVESVYSAVQRAYGEIKPLWPTIEEAHSKNDFEKMKKIIGDFEKSVVIDERLKSQPELLMPYIYHTAKQIIFFEKLVKNGLEARDALYIAPKNIRVRTLENYDLINITDLEFPLRLCSTCEPERKASSWKKRTAILEVVPEIAYFLQPKCNAGFCTEGKFCNRITDMRKYDLELHKATQKAMLDNARK
jgi:hypothetical protein